MEEDWCQRVVSQLCGALSHLHSLGFVHRDLKPENVFLCDAACRWVKLGDYGMVSAQLPWQSLRGHESTMAPVVSCTLNRVTAWFFYIDSRYLHFQWLPLLVGCIHRSILRTFPPLEHT